MGVPTMHIAWRSCLYAVALALAGCGGPVDVSEPIRPVDRDSEVDPEAYVGDVAFRVTESFDVRGTDLPFALLIGVLPESPTRLAVNTFADLRGLQQALPDLLTRKLEPSCGLGLDVAFEGAEAQREELRGRATVKARLYYCHDRGTELERRGFRFFTQDIDVEAVVSASLEGLCIAFRLVDLDLSPRGFTGRLATFLGITETARSAIRKEARAALSENPICPDLPAALLVLDPQFAAVGIREVGEGGIGAALSGTAELTAANLVALIAIAQTGLRDADGTQPSDAAPAERLDIRRDSAIEIRGQKLPYGLDLELAAVAPTRIGIESTLDLRDLQRRLPNLLAGSVPVDSCGSRLTLHQIETEARGANVLARARLNVETFACERTGPVNWQRGEVLDVDDLAIKAEMSAELVDNCVVFRLLDLRGDSPEPVGRTEVVDARVESARELLLNAVGVFLELNPLCPTLPAAIAVLDPEIERGAPQELGDGGIGIMLVGSIDVGPRAFVDVLRLLQERGALPLPP